MTAIPILNPLTQAKLIDTADGQAELHLRCFARRRSYRHAVVAQRHEPELFAALSDWLESGACMTLPEIGLDRTVALMAQGLLISEKELSTVPPGATPVLGDGNRLAAAICPEVAGMLDKGPQLPPPPGSPNAEMAGLGYCEVPAVLSPEDVAAVAAYYRTLGEGNWLLQHRDTDDRRGTIHNDPVARRIHLALSPYVAALLGQAIKPSYTYATEYYEGCLLEAHTDREQCEFTFSLYVGYAPEPADDRCPWPLIVHAPGGDVAFRPVRGGGLLFRGRELPHSRPALPPGHRAFMLFLHYVHEEFGGPLN